jgi:hypothetical protein
MSGTEGASDCQGTRFVAFDLPPGRKGQPVAGADTPIDGMRVLARRALSGAWLPKAFVVFVDGEA